MSRTISVNRVKNLPSLGEGACATVYRYNNEAFKIFKETGEIPSYEELMQIIGINNEACVFPKDVLVDEKGQMVGYVMEYIEGTRLADNIGQINIQSLQLAISKLEQELQLLANDKVLFNDFNIGNVMWEDKTQTIKIIDTDFFQRNQQLTSEQVFHHNLGDFNTQVETMMGVMQGEFANYLRNSESFNEIYNKYMQRQFRGDNVSINELISAIKSVTEKDFGKKFSTLGEMKQEVQGRMKTTQAQIQQTEIPVFQPPEQETPSFYPPSQKKPTVSNTQKEFTINEFGEIIRPHVLEQQPAIKNTEPEKTTLRQKLKQLLSRVPLVRNLVNSQEKALPEPSKQLEMVSGNEETKKDFLNNLTGHGEFLKPEYSQIAETEKTVKEMEEKLLKENKKRSRRN
ncbi:MAG: hypothetical protein IKG14_04945 [Clostridia bacterium]|nr:hypothetical protein [Clostridia bacterium]